MSTLRNLALKQHFTEARPINDLMCHLLGCVEGLTLLEPCVGHGAFLGGLQGVPARIDAVDIDGSALDVVRAEFPNPNIELFRDDFIDLFVQGVMGSAHPVRYRQYDAVISNPPYGLYLDLEYRKRIQRMFPELYARESYGLFFTFAISRLSEGGRYSFLVPDTFLSSVNHRPLRQLMCAQAAPTHIIRFPSKLFETVNFGYGNLCIVAGNKRALTAEDTVRWVDSFDNDGELSIHMPEKTRHIPGADLLYGVDRGWSSDIANYHNQTKTDWNTLGDIAECRTGIYTGDNERFIGYDAHRVTRRLNGHAIDWPTQVCCRSLSYEEAQGGFTTEQPYYVPLIRGGHRSPFQQTAWAIRWDKPAISFYKNDKKARFQNSAFYFREGISVPMVTTARISAAMMENAVFDQGVVGVFPRNPMITPALLLYLNSEYASVTMKSLVNGSANNSANYLKRLPVPPFTDEHLKLAREAVDLLRSEGAPLNEVADRFAADLGAVLPS